MLSNSANIHVSIRPEALSLMPVQVKETMAPSPIIPSTKKTKQVKGRLRKSDQFITVETPQFEER